jgi:protein gp37
MTKTKIDWADEVWNPTTGCRKVSEGCRNCYAERIASRFWGERKFTDVRCHPERLDQPLRWKKPRRVFVDSMSDLFHEDVPDDFIVTVWMRMISCPQHTFIILTKRPKRMAKLVPQIFYNLIEDQVNIQHNVWLGVSVEDQKTADERIPWLLKTPAAVRLVSVEPMLWPVIVPMQLWDFNLVGEVDWVIAGCESGPNARPAEIDWFRSLRDQCVGAGVPFFLKQMKVNGKLVHMPELDGRVWAQYPGSGV